MSWQHEVIANHGSTVMGATIALIEDREDDVIALYDDEHLAEYLLAATILLKSAISLYVKTTQEDVDEEFLIRALRQIAIETMKMQ